MKRPNPKTMIMAVSTGVLIFLLGTVTPKFAQQEQHKHDAKKPLQQEQQAKGQQEQRQHQAKGQQERQQQQANRPTQQEQYAHEGEQRGVWHQHRAHNWQSEHHTWQQRGGYNGYRIPEDHFHGYFGRSHGFRIYSLPLVIFDGYPRFQYEGYWFSLVDPWPEYWSDDWYENDDVYIDYSGDGYYLYNHRYPRDRIAITVCVK